MVWNYVQNKALELFTRIIKIKYSKTEKRMSWISLIPFFFEDFLGQFTLSVIFLTLLGRHRKSAQLFLVSFPDILQTARLTARFWRDIELYLWVITPYCAFRLPEIGGFFQRFHLPMRFDCRKTSVLEREGGTYLRHKCNPVTFPWNRPYFVRKICTLICALSSTIRFLYFSSILTQMKSLAY